MSQQQNLERKVSQPMSLQCPPDFEPEKTYGHKFRMLERIPTEYDARLKRIILTDLAYEGDQKAKCNVYRMEQTIVKGMTDEEACLFNDLLERALHNVEELCCFEEKGESK